MKRATVVVSLVLHAGVAMSLMGAAQKGERRKAISVAVADAKKKKEPPKPPPPPPRPVARAAPRVVASVPKAAPVAAAPKVPARAVETALAMSNDDAPGGIALAPRGAAGAAAAAAPTRVASAVSSARTRRTREALGEGGGTPSSGGEGGDVPCTEEPTKPVPVSRTELEYTTAAKTEGIEGKLKLKLTVAADGSVSDVEVLASVEPALDQVAVAAARQWRFRPAMACGKPVDGGTYVLQKRYELTD